jgi:hypothetical protein
MRPKSEGSDSAEYDSESEGSDSAEYDSDGDDMDYAAKPASKPRAKRLAEVNVPEKQPQPGMLKAMGVRELKAFLSDRGVSILGITEKAELVALAHEAQANVGIQPAKVETVRKQQSALDESPEIHKQAESFNAGSSGATCCCGGISTELCTAVGCSKPICASCTKRCIGCDTSWCESCLAPDQEANVCEKCTSHSVESETGQRCNVSECPNVQPENLGAVGKVEADEAQACTSTPLDSKAETFGNAKRKRHEAFGNIESHQKRARGERGRDASAGGGELEDVVSPSQVMLSSTQTVGAQPPSRDEQLQVFVHELDGELAQTLHGRLLSKLQMWVAGVLGQIGDVEHVVKMLVQNEVTLANLGSFSIDELASIGLGEIVASLLLFNITRNPPCCNSGLT